MELSYHTQGLLILATDKLARSIPFAVMTTSTNCASIIDKTDSHCLFPNFSRIRNNKLLNVMNAVIPDGASFDPS